MADLLAKQGRAEALRQEVDAGTPGAAELLIEVLASADETRQEAVRMFCFGLNPDGNVAERD